MLAWGATIFFDAAKVFSSYQTHWRKIVDAMLRDKNPISRIEAYKRFHKLTLEGDLKGMGPAYYTKLIFFLERNHNGYIMDQWTARSMNLLRTNIESKVQIIRTSRNNKNRYQYFRVDPINNCSCVYQSFCDDLEHLTERLGSNLDQHIPCYAKEFFPSESELARNETTEKLIFSKGGRSEKGSWRQYVLDNTSKPCDKECWKT